MITLVCVYLYAYMYITLLRAWYESTTLLLGEKIQNHNKIEINGIAQREKEKKGNKNNNNDTIWYNQIEMKWGVKEMANILAKSHLLCVQDAHLTWKAFKTAHFRRWMNRLLLLIEIICGAKQKAAKKRKRRIKKTICKIIFFKCFDDVPTINIQTLLLPKALPTHQSLTSINKINIFI